MAEQYYVSKKYHEISILAEETAKQIAKNETEWTKYLDVAARLYKYPCEDQMLIYAQSSDASACATMELWNEKMFCWVNRGSKGIALMDRESGRPRLKYVFDISDVHPARRIGRKPYLWELEESRKDMVIKQLEDSYGRTKEGSLFEERLIEIAGDYYGELLPQFEYLKEGSFLEELDEQNIGIRVRETLASSIAYTLLSRCGADMEAWKNELDFTYIREFNTMDMVSIIRKATTDMCKPVLMEIGRTLAAYEREIFRGRVEPVRAGQKDAGETEKFPGKGIANIPEPRYNALKRESENEEQGKLETAAEQNETEGMEYGTDIREKRRIPNPEPDAEQRAGGAADEVRADAAELLKGADGRGLHSDALKGDAESALSKDTGTGRAEDGPADGTNGGSRRRDGETESVRPDGVGAEDERHPALGRGDRLSGTGLHAVKDGAGQNAGNETQPHREAETPDSGEDSPSGAFLDNLDSAEKAMEIQKGILCSDKFLIHKRPEIAGYFAMEKDSRMQADYLKNSFRMKEYTELDIGEIRAGYYADEEGLTMWKGKYLVREMEARLSWEDARFWVNAYMEDGAYLLPGEAAEKFETKGMYRQLDLFSVFPEQLGTIAMKQAEQGVIPAEKKKPGPKKELLAKEQVSTILRSGGGREGSRKRIYAKYRQGKTPEEMAEFLRKEYGTTGNPYM